MGLFDFFYSLQTILIRSPDHDRQLIFIDRDSPSFNFHLLIASLPSPVQRQVLNCIEWNVSLPSPLFKSDPQQADWIEQWRAGQLIPPRGNSMNFNRAGSDRSDRREAWTWNVFSAASRVDCDLITQHFECLIRQINKPQLSKKSF